MIKKYLLLIVLTTGLMGLIYGCIDPFSPPEVNSDEGYLVVDGFLNAGQDTSRIELRHSQNVNANTAPAFEAGAKVSVQSEAGESFNFTEQGKGLYILPPVRIDLTTKYRLSVVLKGGQEYLSEYVKVSTTPPIDSISTKLDEPRNGMVFMVSTHDPTNNTRFYRWKFEETYEYTASKYSTIMVQGDQIINRPDNIYTCWRSSSSTNIMLGSTIKLSKDEIKDLPLSLVDIATNKLFIKYSLLVKQYGLTREAFEYWTNLSKTTQGTGSLFDPLPSQVTGNIRNKANARELVFGYFSASVETQKRIFVTPHLGYFPQCEADTLPIRCPSPREEPKECAFNTQKLLISYLDNENVLAAPPNCADCRLQGGSTTRPSFWR
ncbi:hypothetical protein DYBT9275_04035 [Dyadobacter sp. CECT 9275]|uniref:DUF4249 domain-containing protein n=1 Tax=Dyadobacter helix TaxID=2822344 RepID=A0A916NML7_9BACT|nr:DUF4249 domain-containing protein [Dyadobacter sp. CECT 9275]CAG5007390.1 hypothetical protein DYBT9275_04035 [Dyadobacter sp. CECT 9275]